MTDGEKNIRIPVEGEVGEHIGHRLRAVIVDELEKVKALYCLEDKKFVAYLFAKNKGWSEEEAKLCVKRSQEKILSLTPIEIDQEEEFLKLALVYKDGNSTVLLPKSKSFILTEEIEEATLGATKARGQGMGVGGARQGDGGTDTCICSNCGYEAKHERGKPCNQETCPECGSVMAGKSEDEEEIKIIKLDKQKQIAYGIFLVPEKADYDGDVISAEDIEKVAHDFMIEYRTIDEMHRQVTDADIVESMIAWKDGMEYFGKRLKQGTWFGAVKVHNKEVWKKIEQGIYKGFSVRIAGRRELIETK